MKRLYLFLILVLMTGSLCAATPQIIDAKKGDSVGVRFGDRCEGLGDINGDGYSDFLVTEFVKETLPGKLHLYLGGPNAFDYPPAITWGNYDHSDGTLCTPLVCLGDITCDGVNDFIGPFAKLDTLKIFTDLANLNAEPQYILLMDTSWDKDGFRAAGGGDNNNDGNPDFWVFRDYMIRDFIHDVEINDTIWGYSGCDLLDTIPDFKIIRSRMPDNKYRMIANELCNTCDLNGDSIPDIIYGQRNNTTSDTPGRACIIWGRDSLSESPDLVLYAPFSHPGDYLFGADLACLGDISGDGIDDLWVSQGGRNYIYHGGRPFDTIPDWAMDYSFMYADIENVGDINNDGWNDVGLFRDDFLINRVSFIYCYPGMDTLVDVWFSDGDYYTALQDGPVCCAGHDHSRLGDVNGDGIDDILLSVRYSNVNGNDYGRIVLQSGWDEPVAVYDEPETALPDKLDLRQNYPNPFNSGTTIEFTLSRSGYTEVAIFNLLGEMIARPVARQLNAGEHRIEWDGRDLDGHALPTGVYFYRIESGDYSATMKMVLLK